MDEDIIVVESTAFPWERMKGEPNRWYMRFHDFLMLGPTRSIAGTMRRNGCRPNSGRNWKDKSIQWNWHRRAEAYDRHQAQMEENLRFETIRSGLALDFQRIKSLKKIADGEEEIIIELQDEVRQDKLGINEALTKRYTSMVSSFAKNLQALAEETGGRVKRVSVKKELRDYALELARSQGYEESTAIQIAEMIALEEEGHR